MRKGKFMMLCAAAWADSMTLTGTFPGTSTLVRWYSESISVSGGVSDYTFWMSDGTLPPGFYIRQDGAAFYLDGIPDTAGKYTFTLRIIDSTNRYVEDEFTVDVKGTPSEAEDMAISAAFASTGEAGAAFRRDCTYVRTARTSTLRERRQRQGITRSL